MMMSQPPAQGQRPGDWICPNCSDLVFAKNDHCRRCQTPKPALGGPPATGSYDMGGYGYAPVQDVSYPSKGSSNNQSQKPGDWICSSCGDLQFARNTSCRRCGAPAPSPGAMAGGGYAMGGYGGGMDGSMGGGMGGGMGGCGMGGGMGRGGPPNMRPGDWECPNCNDHVFAKNDACRRCNTPRPAPGYGQGGYGAGGGNSPAPAPSRAQKMMPGDWNCPKCGDLQFARNSSCRMCSAPKPEEFGGFGGRDRSRSPLRG